MDVQDSSINKKLHLQTPTVFSPPLSKLSGFSVYLKLENLQVPGSFKIRGVGNLCQKAKQNGCKRIVCASGGNAGLGGLKTVGVCRCSFLFIDESCTSMFIMLQLFNVGLTFM
jgi:threonine synthase